MKYAVISDIHANVEALEAVLCAIRKQQIDKILCCGDILGYYCDPNACMELFVESRIHSIVGNHDLAILGEKDLTTFWSVARKAIEWTRPRLSESNRAALRKIPGTIEQKDFVVFHGALHIENSPEDYHLDTDEDVLATMKELGSPQRLARIGFCGHMHRPFAYELCNGELKRRTTKSVSINDDSVFLFNPGSVGQSRDKDERASYLVYDDVLRRVEFQRVEYDRKTTLRKAKRAGLLPEPRVVKHMKNAVRRALKILQLSN